MKGISTKSKQPSTRHPEKNPNSLIGKQSNSQALIKVGTIVDESVHKQKGGGLLKVPGLISRSSTKQPSVSIAASFEDLQRPTAAPGQLTTKEAANSLQHKREIYRQYLAESSSESQAEIIINKCKRLEAAIHKSFEDNRKSREWMVDFCKLGPMNAAPDLMQSILQLEDLFSEMLESQLAAAFRYGVVEKHWKIRRKIIDLFQTILASSSSSLEKLKPQVSRMYFFELDSISNKISFMLALLHRQLRCMPLSAASCAEALQTASVLGTLTAPADDGVDFSQDSSLFAYCLKCSMQALGTELGDLTRYKTLELSRVTSDSRTRSKGCDDAARAYLYACRTAPWSGAALKALSSLSKLRRDGLSTVYHLSRSLCVSSPYDAHEALLSIFEKQKSATESLGQYSALSGLSGGDHVERFKLHFLSCIGIAYTRTDADKFGSHLEKCRRHLASVVQWLELDDSRGASNKAGKSFLEFDKGGHKVSSDLGRMLAGAEDLPKYKTAELLDEAVMQALVSCLSLAHVIANKYNLAGALQSYSWDSSRGEGHVETSSNQQQHQRYFAQYLHAVHSIPGLVDLCRLIFGIVCTFLGAGGVLGDDNPTISPIKLLATTRPAAIFFEWLLNNRDYWIFSIIDKNTWSQLESNTVSYIQSLPRADNTASDSPILDDLVLRGFLPLTVGIEPRFSTSEVEYSSMTESYCPCTDCATGKCDASSSWVIDNAAKSLYTEFNVSARIVRCKSAARVLSLTPLDILNPKSELVVAFDANRQPIGAKNISCLKVLSFPKQFSFVESFNSHTLSSSSAVTSKIKTPSQQSINLISKEIDGDILSIDYNELCKKFEKVANYSTDDHIDSDNDNDDNNVEEDKEDEVSDISDDEILLISSSRVKKSAESSSKPGLIDMRLLGEIPIQGKVSDKKARNRNRKPRHQDAVTGRATRMSQSVSVFGKWTGSELPLIVVDAPNVAMRHGLNAKFSCKGIKLALDFFHTAGHKVIAFLPDYYLSFEKVGELRRVAKLNIQDVRAAKLPDDVNLLMQLVTQGHVIATPSQDYDDSYSIAYAKRHGGFLVTNDMYRDHVEGIQNSNIKTETRSWLKAHCISFTFVGDEFLPNPDASFIG